MSIFSAFSGSVSSLEEAFQARDITSPEMRLAVQRWTAMYLDRSRGKEGDGCQRLPVLIVGKLCKTIFSEYTAAPLTGPRGAWLGELLARLDKARERAVQFQLVGGECFVKPVLAGKESFDFVPIRRDSFLPLARDHHGRITSAATMEVTAQGGQYYTLAERRTAAPDGTLTIESRLYKSETRGPLGSPVPLDTLEQYAALRPELVIPGVHNLGMVQLKTPLFNCVDGSADGVSVYAPAEELIRRINENEAQLSREFENGASRIIASKELVRQDFRGRDRLMDDLFVATEEDPEAGGITIFSPALREASYLARKQEYLRNVESLIGFKRGILSEVEAAERTATEITSSAGDYNLTIQDFQRVWERGLRELLDTCVRLGAHYYQMSDAPVQQKEVAVDWGNGVLYDRDKAWAEQLQMVQAGMLRPEIALAWYYSLPSDTPGDLAKIRERYLPELESLLGG